MGCDEIPYTRTYDDFRFQSTHPVWDATLQQASRPSAARISIHASRMGCDFRHAVNLFHRPRFQSTHPVWDATSTTLGTQRANHFNPRIPYGMRPQRILDAGLAMEFQSTHPVWDATHWPEVLSVYPGFQSTHPVWDATKFHETNYDTTYISIHASRMGCDGLKRPSRNCHNDFNPRIPYGMRLTVRRLFSWSREFQSTHPVWDATSQVEQV